MDPHQAVRAKRAANSDARNDKTDPALKQNVDFMKNANTLNRREFVLRSGMAIGACALMSQVPAQAAPGKRIINKDAVVLFQGDSITDARRSRSETGPNSQPALGNGYAWFAAAQLLVDHPSSNLRTFNRGISGNKVYQLIERWQADCLDLKPDVLSILIGVNDFWHTLTGHYTGTVEKYEADYQKLVEQTRKALPGVKLVLCEPFVLQCGAVDAKWFPEFDKYRAAAARIARASRATWVPFQSMFNEALKYAPPEHWAKDGVHPTEAGASLMAHAWLKAVGA